MSLGLSSCSNMALLCSMAIHVRWSGYVKYRTRCRLCGCGLFIAQLAHVILTLAGCMQSFDTVQPTGTGYIIICMNYYMCMDVDGFLQTTVDFRRKSCRSSALNAECPFFRSEMTPIGGCARGYN